MNRSVKKLSWIFLTFSCHLATSSAICSEIYRIVDETGRITYTDRAADSTENVQQTTIPIDDYRQLFSVKHVYDGDTIVLDNDQRVRLLGVNTPEIASRHREEEPGGTAAKTWLQNRINGQKVYLEQDQEKQDKYQRQLAHVFLADGTHLNLELIRHGLAFMSIIPPNLRYAEAFSRAQKQAEKQKLGIWGEQSYQARPLEQISSSSRGWQRFTGIPRKIQQRRSFTYLVFNDQVSIRIANDHLNLFPKLESYLGKIIEIRGWISRRSNKFTITIQHPSALVVL